MSKSFTSESCEQMAIQYLEKNDPSTSQAYSLLGILKSLNLQTTEIKSLRDELLESQESNIRLLAIADAAASFFSFPSDGKFDLCIKLLDEWDAFVTGEE